MKAKNKEQQLRNIILWEGKSLIDGQPVVAIATGVSSNSSNKKTGSLLQIWILRSDIHPVEAVHSGQDSSICGDCIHRGLRQDGSDRSCYVTLMAPGQIYRSYKAGKYQHWADVDKAEFKELCSRLGGIRWGAYGDPTVIPFEVFQDVAQYSRVNLGYTHQWRNDFASPWKGCLQASCDVLGDTAEAQSLGWKTFTTVTTHYINGEHLCKGGTSTTCQQCKLCDGSKSNVFIPVHGQGGVKYFAANLAPSIV